jgi:copper chaperone
MKLTFIVPDMSCNHCRGRIEKALAASGQASSWTVDLVSKTVSVESTAGAHVISNLLSEAGYPPAEA